MAVFFYYLDGNITWKYNRKMDNMQKRVEDIYKAADFDNSIVTGVFVSCRKITRSKKKKNYDR